jgi:sn-glycerol 3-phosphate transport system permease protein
MPARSWPGLHAGRIAAHAVLIVLALFSLFPIYWMFVTAVRPANEVFGGGVIPTGATLENFAYVWNRTPMGRLLANTFVMAAANTAGQLLTSILAAYAFARWRFPGDRVLFLVFIGTWLIPFQVTMIPNYVLVARLGWLNTLAGLVVPQLAAAFAVVLLRGYMKGFPVAVLDAARVDGASSWRTLWQIVVPNLRGPLAALGILLFISHWNEYFWPLLVTNKVENTVVQVGLQFFLTQEGNQWGPLMAASSLASLPIFALYIALQRQVIDAFVRSGLK